MPGWTVEVLREDREEIAPSRQARPRSRSTFRMARRCRSAGYHEAPERTAEAHSPDGRWYVTGDTGSCDDDGYYFFSSRDDDVIIMGGYRIGPFEVESVLGEHPDVSEAAVVGVPDELRGEVIEPRSWPCGPERDRLRTPSQPSFSSTSSADLRPTRTRAACTSWTPSRARPVARSSDSCCATADAQSSQRTHEGHAPTFG